jgi:hypothetical protein
MDGFNPIYTTMGSSKNTRQVGNKSLTLVLAEYPKTRNANIGHARN